MAQSFVVRYGRMRFLGAFSADLNPLREQGLLTKYAEYMPLGLTPVIIHVT